MSADWNAASYHRVSGPMEEMGLTVLARLQLVGDETVLDAGCGTGRVTAHLVDRLPRGHVIAVDASPAMVAEAREYLGDRADIRQVDLLELELGEPVDAVFSTATFHWILDHERLFGRLFAALRPGGRLVAQCGGHGNIRLVLAAADEVAAAPEYCRRVRRLAPGVALRDRRGDDVPCWSTLASQTFTAGSSRTRSSRTIPSPI